VHHPLVTAGPADGENRPDEQTLLVTISGEDRPGLTSVLFDAIAEIGAEVRDLEQVVVRGQLTLAMLLAAGPDTDKLHEVVRTVGHDLDLKVKVKRGRGDTVRRADGRAAVVVIGSPLQATAVAGITARIAASGANIDRIRRLSQYPVTTVEFDISVADVEHLRRDLALEAADEGVDIAVSAGGLARRGRRLVVLDVDSTLIQQECIELLAAHAGRQQEVAAVTERAMQGELDFTESLRERVQVLAGLDASVLEAVRSEVLLTPGARTLVRTLKRLGFTVAVVSGGFVEIVGPLAADLGIHHVRANQLEVVDGRLTGRLVGEVVDRAGKAAALRDFAEEEGLPLSRTVAIGDGANDLDMLAEAGLGVAFNAKPIVRKQAHTAVTVPYLDAVLFLLGITREEVEEADAADGIPAPASALPSQLVGGS
jgi:phosphoserine phosphatase